MRVFLDAHVSAGRIAAPLRERSHDVRAADEERALDGANDEELLELAARDGRVMVTFDVGDFPDIARAWAEAERSHAGCAILVGIDHSEVGEILRVLDAAFEERGRSEEWRNLTVFLARGS